MTDIELKEYTKKRDEYLEREKEKVDKFDWLMMKYGSWIRVGCNRSYFKEIDYGLQFMCLYDKELFVDKLIQVENEGFKEEDFPTIMRVIEFQGERINVELKKTDITNAAIYTLAGYFTSRRGDHGKIYKEFQELIKAPKNNKEGVWGIEL